MELNVETSGPSLAKVSFTVPGDEFEKEFRNGLRQVGQRVRMKGFRPGKVPVHVLEKQFGDQVRQDLMEHFMRTAYQRAVDEQELKPISHPRVTREGLTRGEDGSFGLEFEISLRPEFTLPSYDSLTITSELEPVMDEQIDQVVEDLRRQESVPEPAEGEGIGENGLVVCDLKFLFGEEAVFEREGIRLAGHTPPPGVEPEKFAAALVGAKVDDEITVEMVLPPTLEKEEAQGQPGTCAMVVREAFKMVPPSDEDLFAKLEVDSEDALRGKVRERLADAADQRERGRLETVLLDQVIAGTEFELPEPLLEEQTDLRLRQLSSQMEQSGVEADKIEAEVEQQRPAAREEAEKGLRALLVVEAIGEKESLLVTNDEIEAELASIAERNDAPVEEVREYYMKNNLGQQMAVEVLERKVRTFLRESAKIEEPS